MYIYFIVVLLVLQQNQLKGKKKSRDRYWMHGLKTIFPYGFNDMVEDGFKIDCIYINVATKILSLPRKHGCANRRNYKSVPLLLPQ